MEYLHNTTLEKDAAGLDFMITQPTQFDKVISCHHLILTSLLQSSTVYAYHMQTGDRVGMSFQGQLISVDSAPGLLANFNVLLTSNSYKDKGPGTDPEFQMPAQILNVSFSGKFRAINLGLETFDDHGDKKTLSPTLNDEEKVPRVPQLLPSVKRRGM